MHKFQNKEYISTRPKLTESFMMLQFCFLSVYILIQVYV